MTNSLIEVKNLKKSYGHTAALDGINLSFKEKSIYGLFGRNGAGKTTLLNIMSSRIFSDSGSVTIAGRDLEKNPDLISSYCCYMPEKHYFPPKMKLGKIMEFAASGFSNYDTEYEYQLCKKFKVDTNKKYEELSRGHQSILRIVLGLASKARITIFDEPVLGLDAVARDNFYSELINEHAETDRMFIISTHYIEESAKLFNESIIIKDGKVICNAPVEELISNVFYVTGNPAKVEDFLKDRKVLASNEINRIKNAVVEGDVETERPRMGMKFSSLTIQKLFIYLTNSDEEAENDNYDQ